VGKPTLADEILSIIQSFAPGYTLKYNKFYIGLAKDGRSNNFMFFRAKKNHLVVEAKLPQSDDWDKKLADADIDQMPYEKSGRTYRIRLSKQEFQKHKPVLQELVKASYDFNK
jgi:hypothetical protein